MVTTREPLFINSYQFCELYDVLQAILMSLSELYFEFAEHHSFTLNFRVVINESGWNVKTKKIHAKTEYDTINNLYST